MKTSICAAILTALVMAGAAYADPITDAQIQNLQNMAQMANAKAHTADAQGDHVSAAKWRKQAHAFLLQAQQLQSNEQNVQNAENQINQIVNSPNN